MKKVQKKRAVLPVLPLRDMVLFPGTISPVFAGRQMSLAAIQAMGKNNQLLILTQKDSATNDPTSEDLYQVGVVATVLQRFTLDDGTVKLLLSALYRVKADDVRMEENYLVGMAVPFDSEEVDEEGAETQAWTDAVTKAFSNYAQTNTNIPKGLAQSLSSKKSLEELVDTVSGYLDIGVAKRQLILEQPSVFMRAEMVLARITELMDKVQIEEKIQRRVKKQMDKNQRDYFLNEQIKAIHKELGRSEDEAADVDQYAERIAASGMSDEARAKAEDELKKLRLMPAMSAEATVVRGYLDTLLGLPWSQKSRVSKNIKQASDILEQDHYGLEKVKERILEYLAVQSRVDKVKAPILCLVGAPGVGKTSLGQSIARATNRKFVRMALGGCT